MPKLNVTLFDRTPKTPKTEDSTKETVPVDYALIVRETLETVAKYGALAIGGYVVLDTARQCAVKATPQH